MGVDIGELTTNVIEARTRAAHEKDNSIIGRLCKSLNINSGKLVRKLDIKHHVGCVALMRIRTGTFMFTNQMVRLGSVPTTTRTSAYVVQKMRKKT